MKSLIHVRTLTGLEALLASELSAVGADSIEAKTRTVVCRGDLAVLYSANLRCRTAIRILRPLATFPAADERALYRGVREVDWSRWLKADGTLVVDANVHSAFSSHSLFIAQLVKDAVVDQFRDKVGKRPSVSLENPDLRIEVSLYQNTATIFVDSSGESLHKRGYRRVAGAAPLNEVLAAGMVMLSGWNRETPFLNPMCGSGTLAIEAVLWSRNIAPGLLRNRFGFQSWPDYDRALYQRLVDEAKSEVKNSNASIVAIDVDPSAVSVAKENAARAGLSGAIRFEQADFLGWEHGLGASGTLAINPPYDERLPVDNVAELFQGIGDKLKRSYGGWTAAILSGNLEAIRFLGLRSASRTLVYNGPIECRLLKYEMRLDAERDHVASTRVTTVRPKWKEKSETLANRIRKNLKHMAKWAKREQISCWRLYDRDIPELPFLIDIYGERLHFAEVERNYDHSPLEHRAYIELMVKTAAEVAAIPEEKVYFKKRKPQKSGGFQYAPHASTNEYVEVPEGGHRFLVNLADYLDVGLFLDHRRTRSMIEKEARGKDFLNLFAYTGSFSVYAAAGGARSTATVDTSRVYLDWANENLKLNGFRGESHRVVRADSFEFLEKTSLRFDLCVIDPPTRSVNRSSGRVFEVQEDHVRLLRLAMARMRPKGRIYFSTNYRTFRLDEAGLRDARVAEITEITRQTTSVDFERRPGHRCWVIELA